MIAGVLPRGLVIPARRPAGVGLFLSVLPGHTKRSLREGVRHDSDLFSGWKHLLRGEGNV
jgi:hypothetical protein